MNSKKKILCIVLAVVAALTVFAVSASAVSWNLSSGSGTSGTISAGANASFSIRKACIGYRFSVVDSTNGYTQGTKQSIDIFRNTDLGREAYTYYAKCDPKYNKRQLVNILSSSTVHGISTYQTTNNCYMETSLGFDASLPSDPAQIKNWAKTSRLNNILITIDGSFSVSVIESNYYRIIAEPLYVIQIDGIQHAMTVTEMAAFGRTKFGGNVTPSSSTNSGSWEFITNFTNYTFPNSVFTPEADSLKLSSGGSLWGTASALTGRTFFNNIIFNGYGVTVAYGATAPTVVKTLLDDNGGSGGGTHGILGSGGSNYIYYKYTATDNTYYKYVNGTAVTTKISKVNIPTKTNCVFLGYYADKYDPDSVQYVKSDGTINNLYKVKQDSVIYAHWRQRKINLHYHANGGTVSSSTYQISTNTGNRRGYIASKTAPGGWYTQSLQDSNGNLVEKFKALSASGIGLTKSGYIFDGWSLETTCLYDDESTSKIFDDILESRTSRLLEEANYEDSGDVDITLYARWSPLVKVKLDKQGGTGGTNDFYYKYGWKFFYDTKAHASFPCYLDFFTAITTHTGQISKITIPTKAGYSFEGYWTSTNGGIQYIDSAGTIKPTLVYLSADTVNGVTLYAHWKPIRYKVNYYVDGSMVKTVDQIDYGQSIKLLDRAALAGINSSYGNRKYEGCDSTYWGKWYTDANCKNLKSGFGNTVSNLTTTNGGTVNLYTKSYIKIYYRISDSVSNTTSWGGDCDSNANLKKSGSVTTKTLYYGANLGKDGLHDVTGFNLSRTGYHLETETKGTYAWYTGAGGTGKGYKQSADYGFSDFIGYANTNGNVILYGHWVRTNYTITYNPNGGKWSDGTTANKTQTYNIDSTDRLYAGPTKTGYTFAGWKVKANVGNWSTTAKPYNSNPMPQLYRKWGNVTLEAQWTPNTYKVKFNGNGNTSGSMSDQQHTYDTAKALTANAFKRQFTVNYNYHGATGGNSTASAKATATFNGWATSASGNKAYNDKQSVKNLTATNGGTVNLYAKWTDASVKLPTPTRTGYTFQGWYTAASGGTKKGNGGASYTPYNNGCTVDSPSITLHAQWTPNNYTIKYVLDGGALPSSQNSVFTASTGTKYQQNPTTQKYDGPELSGYGTFFRVENPTRSGYTSVGWNITGMDSCTHYHTGSSNTFTSTSLSGVKHVYYKNLRATSGTVTFTAVWEHTLTARFHYMKADGSGTTYIDIPVTVPGATTSKAVTAPNDKVSNCSKGGVNYNFTRTWSDTTSATKTPVTSFTATKAIKHYYAVYTRSVKITYDGNGSTASPVTGSTASQEGTAYYPYDLVSDRAIGHTFTLATNGFSRTGYTFDATKGWNESASSTTSAVHKQGTKWTCKFNNTLYARWTPINYSITYYYVKPDGSTAKYTSLSPTSYTVNTATFTLPTPTVPSGYDGLVNSDWFTNKDGTEIV